MYKAAWKLVREIFHAGSEVGINLLLWNTLALFWYASVSGKDIAPGIVTIILGIFGAKTAHSVTKAVKGGGQPAHKPEDEAAGQGGGVMDKPAFGHASGNGHCCGMTLLEYYAGEALKGLLSELAHPDCVGPSVGYDEETAGRCFRLASAMVREAAKYKND